MTPAGLPTLAIFHGERGGLSHQALPHCGGTEGVIFSKSQGWTLSSKGGKQVNSQSGFVTTCYRAEDTL